MNKNVFREYDIRGIVNSDFKKDFVIKLGKSFGTYLKRHQHNKVSISGDIRLTTDKLKNNFINGLLDVGIDVYDIGILPTPVNYFSLFNTDIVNSVQITGSHNPSEYNGFKLSFNKKPFFGKQIQELKEYIIENNFFNSNKKGSLYDLNVVDDYVDFITNDISLGNKKIKCIMDCGNATGGIIAPQLFNKLNIEIDELFCNIDSNFPNHHPDPTVDSNLSDIINIMKDNKTYDLGIAYDGDADRFVAIDEKGEIVRSDILMGVFVEDIISKDDVVVFDVKCSRALDYMIRKQMATPLMWKTGHSLIKNKMIEMKSKFGGEMSGHLFFSDRYFGYDDGIYTSLRLVELLSKSKLSLSELVSRIPKYYSTPEIRIDCKNDDEKFLIVNEIKNYFMSKYNYNDIDGLRIEFDFGWGLIRASNTQPVIVCRFEANSNKKLDEIKNIIFDKISDYGDFKFEF